MLDILSNYRFLLNVDNINNYKTVMTLIKESVQAQYVCEADNVCCMFYSLLSMLSLLQVVVTIYWLGRSVQPWYKGPHLDCSAFLDLIGYHHPKVRLTKNIVDSTSENIISEELHCRQESCDSLDRSSGYSSYRGDSKTSSSSYSQHHSRQESSDSVDRNSVYRNDTTKSSLSSDVFEDDPVTSHLRDESYESFVSEDLPLTRRLNSDKRPSDNITPDTGETDNMPIPQEYRRRASHSNRFAEQRYSATFDSTYMPPPDGARSPNLLSNRWKHDAVYQSTPQLNRDSHNDHNRFRFGDNKLENQGIASSSSDNIDGAKPGERRNSTVRKTSTAHADPLQFVYVGGSQLSQKAKEVIEAMEEQKKITKALEHEELDWHSVSTDNTLFNFPLLLPHCGVEAKSLSLFCPLNELPPSITIFCQSLPISAVHLCPF